MNTDTPYRIVGNITVKNKASRYTITKGKPTKISYGIGETNFDDVAIIQSRETLTSQAPYFLVEVQKCDPKAKVSIGIGPLDIDSHAGLYNNSIGYYNDTGRIYTSWKVHANTLGVPYSGGNTIAMYVTYFGENLSTVLIYYDNTPIATRYHFEGNKTRYHPTITFSGGPVHIAVLWPNSVDRLPRVTDIPIPKWIRGPCSTFDAKTGYFENSNKLEDIPIQSPIPLSKSFQCFIVTQHEVSQTDGKGAGVGLATFSPLKPTPTCSLMKDYYTWQSKTKMKIGSTIAWGIYYDDDCTNDKAEQLCLLFVMRNKSIVDALFVVQPEGGFVPIVLLQPYATKVSIERYDVLTTEELSKLQGLYLQLWRPALEIYRKDKEDRNLSERWFRKSQQVLLNTDDHTCRVSIPKTENSIHYIQFCQPLTPERRFFFVELETISPLCQITVGIASADHELNEAPGTVLHTVGYNSYTGKLYANRTDIGNMRGHKCKKGDTMGIAIEAFDKEMSVVLFSKNFRPIGTRYLTLRDHSKYFPTILIENNGDPVDLLVHWQTRVSVPPQYDLRNPEDWCIPDGATIDLKENMYILPPHLDHSLCIQAPCSLNNKYHHFEIILLEKFSDTDPPPAIALCTASPLDPPPTSQFKQDYLRFWPTGDAATYLKQGDKIGWGILFPEEEQRFNGSDQEQLIICYLSVNRTVGYVRVLQQPIGGFYPVIIAPPNINLIQLDFSATGVLTEDFTREQIQLMLSDARQQIEEEEQLTQVTESVDIYSNLNTRIASGKSFETNSPVPSFNAPEQDYRVPESAKTPTKSSTCVIA